MAKDMTVASSDGCFTCGIGAEIRDVPASQATGGEGEALSCPVCEGLMTVERVTGPYTRQLAEFVDRLSYEDLPAPVIEKTKGALLDYLGAAFAGSTRPHARRALSVVRSLGGVEESTILGTREKTAADRAAFVNSLFGSSAPQLDDVHKESLGHPGVGTIPASLAIAERVGAGGKELITAIVAGYEIAIRIGAAVGKGAFDRGWHPRAGCNVFAAAVASGKLLGLEGADNYCAVLGLAGNKASGLVAAAFFYEAFYTLSGNASRDGVEAALLAEAGYDAGCTILEAERGGYCHLVCDEPDWARLTDGLGERFEILSIAQKPYSSCMCAHAVIDATLSIVEQHHIQARDVERIRVEGFREIAETFGQRYPENPVHATMSIPYLVAVAITDRRVLPPQLEKLADPQIASLQERVELVLDPELEKLYPHYLGATVEISTVHGGQWRESVRIPKGDPENPLSPRELQSKFSTLAGEVLDRDTVQEALQMIDGLETLVDVGALTSVLRRLR